ncbi:hypothetical protein ZWY2020_012740 [Hordeum vulgare]|nr:hypothetical protein ZWY2020_012740 [Hordeum vulgare]
MRAVPCRGLAAAVKANSGLPVPPPPSAESFGSTLASSPSCSVSGRRSMVALIPELANLTEPFRAAVESPCRQNNFYRARMLGTRRTVR